MYVTNGRSIKGVDPIAVNSRWSARGRYEIALGLPPLRQSADSHAAGARAALSHPLGSETRELGAPSRPPPEKIAELGSGSAAPTNNSSAPVARCAMHPGADHPQQRLPAPAPGTGAAPECQQLAGRSSTCAPTAAPAGRSRAIDQNSLHVLVGSNPGDQEGTVRHKAEALFQGGRTKSGERPQHSSVVSAKSVVPLLSFTTDSITLKPESVIRSNIAKCARARTIR